MKYIRNEAYPEGQFSKFHILTIIILIIVFVIAMRCITVVPAGNIAILDVFGKVSDRILDPGLKFPINPFANKITMDVRTKEIKETMHVPTREGLMAGLDISILFRLDATKANEVYKQVGVTYTEVIVQPMLRNVVRDVVSGFSSEDLYSQNRQKISSEIFRLLKEAYAPRGVTLENVLLRDVQLPQEVTAAIEQKIKAKQQAEQMQYVLEKEKSEAKRKTIEAEGISSAQKVISQSLTPEYLQWRYITTLEQLVDSKNTTFLIAPFDQKLIPMLPLDTKK